MLSLSKQEDVQAFSPFIAVMVPVAGRFLWRLGDAAAIMPAQKGREWAEPAGSPKPADRA